MKSITSIDEDAYIMVATNGLLVKVLEKLFQGWFELRETW